jgi:hypothetical protein
MSGDLWAFGVIGLLAAAGLARRGSVDGARNRHASAQKYEIEITRGGRYYIKNLITGETSLQYGEDWATSQEAGRALRRLKQALQKAAA